MSTACSKFGCNPYTLPQLEFIAGETQNLSFHCHYATNEEEFPLERCSAQISIVHFVNRVGSPILTKSMGIAKNDTGTMYSKLTVTLTPTETVALSGKYVYQISIKDTSGVIEIPKQGIMYITNNIHKSFITG